MARAESRLDQPKAIRPIVPRPHYDPEAFGRFSETIARFLGTARFLVMQTGLVILWISYNGWTSYNYFVRKQGPAPFDRYPFILLNLAFSTQAAYAAPLILLAQNRQADRDRVALDEDRARTERALAEAEFLAREVAAIRIALGEVATRDFLRSELRDLADEVQADRRADARADDAS